MIELQHSRGSVGDVWLLWYESHWRKYLIFVLSRCNFFWKLRLSSISSNYKNIPNNHTYSLASLFVPEGSMCIYRELFRTLGGKFLLQCWQVMICTIRLLLRCCGVLLLHCIAAILETTLVAQLWCCVSWANLWVYECRELNRGFQSPLRPLVLM